MERILFVDDEVNLLDGMRRVLRRNYDVATADGGAAGLEVIERDGPFAVVVSDYRMPGMNGVEFLERVREISPDTVRMMLTGQADMAGVVGAINRSKVFRYLNKPLMRQDLLEALDDALAQYRLVIAERQLLEETLRGSIQALVDLLGMVNPVAFSRAARIERCVAHLVSGLTPPDPWEFEIAGMLSQVGCATLPPETLQKVLAGQPVSDAEREMFTHHPRAGASLLQGIPRLERVAEMIRRQRPGEDAGEPGGSDSRVELGAELIRLASAFDELAGQGLSKRDIRARLRSWDPPFDEVHLDLLEQFHEEEVTGASVKAVSLRELAPGMIFDQEVAADNGVILVSPGQEVTRPLILRLLNFDKGIGIQQPIRVRVPAPADRRSPLVGAEENR